MSSGRSDLVDIAATRMRESKRAVLLDVGNVDRQGKPAGEWFPKALIEDNGDGTFAMPEWLAKEKGAI